MAVGNYNHGNNRNREGGGRNQHYPQNDGNQLIEGKALGEWKPQIQVWIKEGISKETISFAEAMGKRLKDENLTTSQIRNVFGEMRKIQMNGFKNEEANFLLLRPKLAYAAKRQQAKGLDKFYELFCIGYDSVDLKMNDSEIQYDRLLQIMEAVLAYHKFHGGQ